MGYTSSTDTQQQIGCTFETREAAEAYARREGIAYTVTSRTIGPPSASPIPTISATTASSPGRISPLRPVAGLCLIHAMFPAQSMP